MGSRFAHDFSAVRVHIDSRAAESAEAVSASAFTVGRDIVFGAGHYEPGTTVGDNLLAHELSHVIQQSGVSRRPGPLPISDPNGADEREARNAELGVAAASPTTQGQQSVSRKAKGKADTSPSSPAREVIAIRLGHHEAGGLGRFDTLLYRDCSMKVQLRMNFNFTGAWPSEVDKRSWQQRFISSVRSAWSERFDLEAQGACSAGCKRVQPFVEIYAPHSSPHVDVNVKYTDKAITSRAGYGVAHLDSLDLTPERKGNLTDEQRTRKVVAPMTPAVHEFGHLIGRDDQYLGGASCAPGYPLAGIMCFGNAVTEADYDPFAKAASQMTGCTYQVVARKISNLPPPTQSDTAVA